MADEDKRAKYSQKQRDEMAASGEAMSDGSYPIKDEDDLKRAIRAVGRGNASHDAIRKHIVARAKALGLSSLIPDNWSSDGSLKEANSVWSTLEERETWNDLYTGLQAALSDELDGYVWVQDLTATEVIYCCGGELLAAPFKVYADGAIVLGEAIKVRPVTTYVETTRNAGPLLEWRRKKATELRGLERRRFTASDVEIREADDGTLRLTGYASVTETPYEVGFYSETIKRGAFKRTLGEQPDVQLLVNHEGLPLARTKSGTLSLSEDERGLKVDADLDPEDPEVQSLVRKMRRGDIDQMSFAFQATDQDWNDDYTERHIRGVSLHRGDVSVVNQAANPAATASVRSAEALRALQRLGGEAVIAGLAEWRDHTLLPLEERAGKALSSATMEVLTNVLNLVASADEAVDEAQPLLAELMGVPNPDTDDDGPGGEDGEPDTPAASSETDGRTVRDPGRELREWQALDRARRHHG